MYAEMYRWFTETSGLDDFWLCNNTWDVERPNTWDVREGASTSAHHEFPQELLTPMEPSEYALEHLAPASVSFDFTNHELVQAAYHNGEFTVTKRASSAGECLPADGTFFWCQQPGSSTDNYDYCGHNYNCPFGPCCYCGGCLKYSTATMGSPTASQSTCPSGQFDNLEGTAGNPVCESCSGLSGDCDDCVCPDFTPQIEANCKAACSLPR